MACDYCNGMKDLYTRNECLSLKRDAYTGFEVSIDSGMLLIDCIADTYEPNFTEAEIPINFCPMCGEKLSEKNEEESANFILANSVCGKLEDLFPRNFVVTDVIAKSMVGASIKNSEGDIIGVIENVDLANGEWTGKATMDVTSFQASSSTEIKGGQNETRKL